MKIAYLHVLTLFFYKNGIHGKSYIVLFIFWVKCVWLDYTNMRCINFNQLMRIVCFISNLLLHTRVIFYHNWYTISRTNSIIFGRSKNAKTGMYPNIFTSNVKHMHVLKVQMKKESRIPMDKRVSIWCFTCFNHFDFHFHFANYIVDANHDFVTPWQYNA